MRPHRRFAAAALLSATLPLAAQQPAPQAAGPVTITVDLAAAPIPYSPVFNWFGYDEGNYTTAPHGRALLHELHDLSPVPVYIRAHHLLTSGDGTPELKWSSTGVYHEDKDGKPVYDFTILDGIFDSYAAAGVRPMVELGFMPRDLAATLPDRHEPYQVHFPKNTISGASNNPPKDYAKWRDLTHAVAAHLVQRYGADTVRQWPFEVWNEPNIDYWHGSEDDYLRLYDFAVAGVRAALPDAKVGGPATTSPRNDHARAYLETFLAHIDHGTSAATGGPVPLDFISFHAKGQPVIAAGEVTMGLREELRDADRGFATIAAHPKLQHLPIILSEADPEGCAACSSKQNPANNYRNGTLYPAYTAAAYKGLLDLARQHNVNLLSMLSWSFEFEDRDYFEGFRDLSTNGVDKPILNLFRMLGLLEGQRLPTSSTGALPLPTLLESGAHTASTIDALATATPRTASVLAWNYNDHATAPDAAQTTLTVTHLPHRILVTQYRIDNLHSDAYTLWQSMGSPQHPTPDQLATLKTHDGLELFGSPTWLQTEAGQIHLNVNLPPQSVALFQLTW